MQDAPGLIPDFLKTRSGGLPVNQRLRRERTGWGLRGTKEPDRWGRSNLRPWLGRLSKDQSSKSSSVSHSSEFLFLRNGALKPFSAHFLWAVFLHYLSLLSWKRLWSKTMAQKTYIEIIFLLCTIDTWYHSQSGSVFWISASMLQVSLNAKTHYTLFPKLD